MSLGDNTKCDLCADEATIDRTELVKALRYSFCQLRLEIADIAAGDIYYSPASIDKLASQFNAYSSKSLERKVKVLQKTAELLDTIVNSKTRENIVLKD